MTRETPLAPSEFAEAVADYAHAVENEQHVRLAYAGQLVAIDDPSREPLDDVDFVASLIANAGVDVDAVDRDRLEHAYSRQIKRAQSAGGSR